MGRLQAVWLQLCGLLFFALGAHANTLSGVVVDAARSQVIPGATVEVAVLIPDSVSFFGTSDASGSYTITGFPAANQIYVIRCYHTGYAPFYMRYDALSTGDRKVDILLQPEPTFPPGGGGDSATVSGAVLGESTGGERNPVAQATLTFTSGLSQAVVHTASDGRYTLRVRRASYGLTVTAAGFRSVTAAGLAVDSVGLTLSILLEADLAPVREGGNILPASFALESPFPNPFNPSTTIRYSLPQRSRVRLSAYNALGQHVADLVSQFQEAGFHEVRFPAGWGPALASGIYFFRLQAGNLVQTRGAVLSR